VSTLLRRVVGETVALGLLLPLLALVVLRDSGAVLPVRGVVHPGPHHLWLALALLLLTVVANLVAVPVRRGDQVEELTLLESALVVDVLLLPAVHAIWLPVAAVVLSSVAARRDRVKSLFNAANLAVSSAVLVLIVHLVSGPGSGLSARTVLGLVLGLMAFTAVNLVNLARVLTAVQELEARAVLSDGWRLAVLTLPGHLSIAGTGVLAMDAAPALLPVALVPAVALLVAFRARAQEAEERTRSARLLALSHALAVRRERDDLLPTFLHLCREAFDADVALALLPGEPAQAFEQKRGELFRGRDATAEERAVLASNTGDGHRPVAPAGGTGPDGVVAVLEADGRRLGVVVLCKSRRRQRLEARELLLLTPLANLLAAALQAAEHVQRLTEATSKLQAVVDQSSDGILVLDGAGTVQLWSPALSALTGCTEREAVGRPLDDLLDATDTEGAACDPFALGRALLSPTTQQASVEMTLRRRDGEQRVVRFGHAGAFVGDRLLRDVVIVHDVTRERQVERLKADFIATVSHELRTPITPIKGYADLLLRRGDAMTPQRRQECLEVISDRSQHLARLVEDLLLTSRISASQGNVSRHVAVGPGDLVPLVRRAAVDFGAEGARVRLLLPDGPAYACFDPTRTVQVLSNLLGNALKYSLPGTPVDVSLTLTQGGVQVAVTDIGRGIPADQLDRVFDKFHRVEDPLRMTTSGTGLGLYIARQLTTAMGGTLTASSSLGVGSTFTLRLPGAPAAAARELSGRLAAGAVPVPHPRPGPTPVAAVSRQALA